MSLNQFKKEVEKFEKKAGFSKTSKKELVKMLQKELSLLKKSDRKKAYHQVMDLQFLILQLANRYKINLDVEFKKSMKKKEKYL